MIFAFRFDFVWRRIITAAWRKIFLYDSIEDYARNALHIRFQSISKYIASTAPRKTSPQSQRGFPLDEFSRMVCTWKLLSVVVVDIEMRVLIKRALMWFYDRFLFACVLLFAICVLQFYFFSVSSPYMHFSLAVFMAL